jgi:hypothetical protein
MKKNKYLFLDIDGVLTTANQFNMKKRHPKYDCYPFDKKCIKILNEIIEVADPILILSSDWKYHYNKTEINEIFEWNGIIKLINDFTISLWGNTFKTLNELELCRATEINEYITKRNLTDNKWVAIDDLDLSPFLSNEHFIQTPKVYEGIKQTGIKEKILKRLL